MRGRGGYRGNGGYYRPRNAYQNGRQFRSRSPPRGRASVRNADEWALWTELTVRVRGLPSSALTINVYDILSPEGNISKIDLLEHSNGIRTGDALVTFSPPPGRAFWDLDDWKLALDEQPGSPTFPLKISLQERKRPFGHSSPLNPSKVYPERMVLHPTAVDIGFMYQRNEMMVMQSNKAADNGSITMLVNLVRRELVFEFFIAIPDSRRPLANMHKDRVKFQIPFHQLDTIWEIDGKDSERTLVITLDKPPAFYRRLHDVDLSFNDGKHWNERFRWARMTEIKQLGQEQSDKALRLKKSDDVIDIGRWTTYRLSFNGAKMSRAMYDLIKSVLTDYNVKFLHPGRFKTVPRIETTIWDWIDLPDPSRSARESFLQAMSSDARHLPWPVRYQLESCISLGIFNERNITLDFINHLEDMSEHEALIRLEVAADHRTRIFNPMDILHSPIPKTAFSKKVPSHCMLQRSATITPSTIYFNPRTVEMSNRILRQYKEHSDRFLRVRFTDEKFEGRIHPSDDDTQDAVFTKVYNCLKQGITIGDRHFDFLAMGNSQFREHGAYFFASTPALTAAMIREQLGKIGKMRNDEFIPERVVAKYASRLGQCFSTTHPIRGMKIKVIEIPDVERHGYTFTDGVGKLSPFVAKMIATELNFRETFLEPPSLFQFRMGGIKGVVAVSPELKGNEMHVRGSQYKFAAIYEGLEIIRCSSYCVPRLNRQLITVLRSLRIPDQVFLRKMSNELTRLERAMKDENLALEMLTEQVDFNQMTLAVANIIHDGFMRAQDPFAASVLGLWRAWTTKQLKDKAALTIQNGAFLLGCTDETATLRGWFDNSFNPTTATAAERIAALPEIFVQISDPNQRGAYKAIEGVCIVARNPSLHPGDVRVVRAVNISKLHHLRDVVVFPQTGDRDLPNMCSGGDLDGDDYIVSWDKTLIPPSEEWNVAAMDFTGPKPVEVEKVTLNDLVSFFVMYMKTDTLRTIATSHLANADQLPGGVRHSRCLELANEHSIAVDYPKSGVPPNPIHKLRPFKYPHFMTNRRRPKDRIYHSETVLGQLYDAVPEPDFRPVARYAFDRRVLDAFTHDDDLLRKVSELKAEYDAAMRRIMAQHEIKTEFEVWTTFVMDHAQLSNEYKFHEEIGRVSSSLKEQYTELCYQRAGSKDYTVMAPFIAAMYTVTAMEVDEAQTRLKKQGRTEVGHNELPFISFPWLFHRELGKIARGSRAAIEKSVVPHPAVKRNTRKALKLIDIDDEDDKIETAEGEVTHRGDVLALPALRQSDETTDARRQHVAMVGKSIKELYSSPQLDMKAAKAGAFALGTWDYDDPMEEVDLEEGEIAKEDPVPVNDLFGLRLGPEPDAEDSGAVRLQTNEAADDLLGIKLVLEAQAPGEDYATAFFRGTSTASSEDLFADEQIENLRRHDNKTTPFDKDPVISHGLFNRFYNDSSGVDTDMTSGEGEDGEEDDTTEEVMIYADQEPSGFDKLERILRS